MLDKNKVIVPERFAHHPIFNELICGMNFGFLAKRGYYLQSEIQAQPAIIQKVGVNWVTLNMSFCQSNFYSRKLFLDFEFSTGELELSEMVKNLHAHGIKVLFKPCLTPLDGAWMGNIDFPECKQIQGLESTYWYEWFDSFIQAEKYFAELAERIGMDAMIIGAEYYGTEGQDDAWRNVIKEIRNLYSGPITYEFMPSSHQRFKLSWFDELDFLSYSYYPAACPPNGTPPNARTNSDYSVEQMKEYLSVQCSKIEEVCKKFGNKPIAFTEYGVRSAHGCIMRPYDYLWDTYYDGEEQANYMEASFQTFWDIPQWMGFFWWKWDETQNRPHYYGDPGGNKGFTVQGKPAEKVLKHWVAKNKK